MTDKPNLHPSIVSMVSLGASIAANHPSMGLCQVSKLRELGIPEHQIDTVIEVARHIRDEAGDKLDAAFDAEAGTAAAEVATGSEGGGCCGAAESAPEPDLEAAREDEGGCCGTTASGQSCC
ncbi:MAG: hypothetical protein ACQERG_04385 [Pseudomonadota bacterium]